MSVDREVSGDCDHPRMTDLQVGRVLRELRRRLRLTQRQLGLRVGVSQQTISLIERGHGSRLSSNTLRKVFAAVDARWEPTVSWRGGALDRLLDDAHARLVAEVVDRLQRTGWEVAVEATYSEFGKRGSIDVLGGRRERPGRADGRGEVGPDRDRGHGPQGRREGADRPQIGVSKQVRVPTGDRRQAARASGHGRRPATRARLRDRSRRCLSVTRCRRSPLAAPTERRHVRTRVCRRYQPEGWYGQTRRAATSQVSSPTFGLSPIRWRIGARRADPARTTTRVGICEKGPRAARPASGAPSTRAGVSGAPTERRAHRAARPPRARQDPDRKVGDGASPTGRRSPRPRRWRRPHRRHRPRPRGSLPFGQYSSFWTWSSGKPRRGASPRPTGSCPGCRRCRRSSSPASGPSSSRTGAEDRLDPARPAGPARVRGIGRPRHRRHERHRVGAGRLPALEQLAIAELVGRRRRR